MNWICRLFGHTDPEAKDSGRCTDHTSVVCYVCKRCGTLLSVAIRSSGRGWPEGSA